MRLRRYLIEAFTREQKQELEHKILNQLMDPTLSRLLKKIKATKAENLMISKKEVEDALDIYKKVRDAILSLPLERGR